MFVCQLKNVLGFNFQPSNQGMPAPLPATWAAYFSCQSNTNTVNEESSERPFASLSVGLAVRAALNLRVCAIVACERRASAEFSRNPGTRRFCPPNIWHITPCSTAISCRGSTRSVCEDMVVFFGFIEKPTHLLSVLCAFHSRPRHDDDES